MQDDGPIVIAHRGASGYRPEHSLSAYALGIEQGADYIEPDLVMTSDGHLVARHDAYLSDSTDVEEHPEFADRRRVVQGKNDWWVFDFTLAEIKTLRARQARPNTRSTAFDGKEQVPTIEEIVALLLEKRGDRNVGLYVEMKHPLEHIALGLDPTEALMRFFSQAKKNDIPTYFQCFSGEYLQQVSGKFEAPLIWLIEGVEDSETGEQKLDVDLALHQDILTGVGLYKKLILGGNGEPTGVLRNAHRLGYKVHLWTFRDDQIGEGFATIEDELAAYWALGIDGVFTDFPDTGVRSLSAKRP